MTEEADLELAKQAIDGDPRALIRLLRNQISKIEIPPPEPIVLPPTPESHFSAREEAAPGALVVLTVALPGYSDARDFRCNGVSIFLSCPWEPQLDGVRVSMFRSHTGRHTYGLGRMLFKTTDQPPVPPFVPAAFVEWHLPLASSVTFDFTNPLAEPFGAIAALHGEWVERPPLPPAEEPEPRYGPGPTSHTPRAPEAPCGGCGHDAHPGGLCRNHRCRCHWR